jgi:anti-sigma B factor antagonist
MIARLVAGSSCRRRRTLACLDQYPVILSRLNYFGGVCFSQHYPGRPGMKITERKVGDVTVLDIEGKILLGEGNVQLKRKIDELVERNEIRVVLNLEQVPYMDSGGLGEIVRSYTTATRVGGNLKLLNATKRISDLLTITKLITVFEVFENEDAAVQSFGLGK